MPGGYDSLRDSFCQLTDCISYIVERASRVLSLAQTDVLAEIGFSIFLSMYSCHSDLHVNTIVLILR